MKNNFNGFTLLELVIVIIIIGVLASLALPRLFRVVEYARSAEAISVFATIRRQYETAVLMQNENYLAILSGTLAGFWQRIGMENPSNNPGSHFDYMMTGASWDGSFSVTATRNVVNGGDPGSGITFWYCRNAPMVSCGWGNFSRLGECPSSWAEACD